jgi:hypothetical protein
MTVQIPSANTLLDQTFFSQVATDINTLNDKVSKTSSQIYNTSTNKQVTSFTGSFSIATYQVDITAHKTSATVSTISKRETAPFGITFTAPPIVIATIQIPGDSTTGAGTTHKGLDSASVLVQNVTQSSADIYVVLGKGSAVDLSYKVNVMAIGLVSL